MKFILQEFWDSSGAKLWKSCRSRETLQNNYLVVKIGVDTAVFGVKLESPVNLIVLGRFFFHMKEIAKNFDRNKVDSLKYH